MTDEATFQAQVVELARILGWRCNHHRRSIGKGNRWTTATSVVGFPDLTLWRRGRIVFAELKSATGRLTPEQREVLASLAEAGPEVYVWRPSDFDEIKRVLSKRGAVAS